MMPTSDAVAAAVEATAAAAAAAARVARQAASDRKTTNSTPAPATQANAVVADVERRALRKELQKWNRAALMAVGE